MTKEQIIARAKDIISRYGTASAADADRLIPDEIGKGKLYEAHVLAKVIERLAVDEGYDVRLHQGGLLKLKSAPGPINRTYPHFRLYRGGQLLAVASELPRQPLPTQRVRQARSSQRVGGGLDDLVRDRRRRAWSWAVGLAVDSGTLIPEQDRAHAAPR